MCLKTLTAGMLLGLDMNAARKRILTKSEALTVKLLQLQCPQPVMPRLEISVPRAAPAPSNG